MLVQECQGVPSSFLPPRAARAQQGVGRQLGRRDIDEEVLQQEEQEDEDETGEEEEVSKEEVAAGVEKQIQICENEILVCREDDDVKLVERYCCCCCC